VIIRRGNHTQTTETGETPMNHQPSSIGPKTPSIIEPLDKDKPQPIRDWQQRYERYLFLTGRKATQERYARALQRFLDKHRGLTYPHLFLRPVINDYVETRLGEGASVATVRLELSAIRGLFQFMLEMGAPDVMFNPAKGVKVRKPKDGTLWPAQNETTEAAA
jgi:site-specific recombinase XerC